eukprot:2575711-Amphidinium_carterae.1
MPQGANASERANARNNATLAQLCHGSTRTRIRCSSSFGSVGMAPTKHCVYGFVTGVAVGMALLGFGSSCRSNLWMRHRTNTLAMPLVSKLTNLAWLHRRER